MFEIIDTETRERIARFLTEQYARWAGLAISRESHRPLTLRRERCHGPIARFQDGKEIPATATIHAFDGTW